MNVRHELLVISIATVLGATACHHRPETVTWERAHPGLQSESTAPNKSMRNKRKPRPKPKREPDRAMSERAEAERARQARRPDDTFGGDAKTATQTSAGLQIDRALLEFQSVRASARHEGTLSTVAKIQWAAVLTAIEDACAQEPVPEDFGAFVRARAILDVEQTKDTERGRALPTLMTDRLGHVFDMMDARVAELRLSSGRLQMGPTILDGDGVIVFHSPLSTMVLTSPYGVRIDPITGKKRFHAGVDFGAPMGTSISASADGIIVYAGWQGGYGRHVVIEHGHGVRSHYSHMESIFVSAGQKVSAGRVIGGVGASGRATGPHLHFAVTNEKGRFIDPVDAIEKPVVVEGARKSVAVR